MYVVVCTYEYIECMDDDLRCRTACHLFASIGGCVRFPRAGSTQPVKLSGSALMWRMYLRQEVYPCRICCLCPCRPSLPSLLSLPLLPILAVFAVFALAVHPAVHPAVILPPSFLSWPSLPSLLCAVFANTPLSTSSSPREGGGVSCRTTLVSACLLMAAHPMACCVVV